MVVFGATIVISTINKRRTTMWTKPATTEMRFGMEITAYIMNR